MNLLKRRDEAAGPRDQVVVLDQDTKQADILPVSEVHADRVVAAGMDGAQVFPSQDLTQFVGPEGRIFVLGASAEYVQETKHLAEVEMATVVREAVSYQRPGAAETKGNPLWKLLPWVMVLVVLILWVTKK